MNPLHVKLTLLLPLLLVGCSSSKLRTVEVGVPSLEDWQGKPGVQLTSSRRMLNGWGDVKLRAHLVGHLDFCPHVIFDFGDGVMAERVSTCHEGVEPERYYYAEHRYEVRYDRTYNARVLVFEEGTKNLKLINSISIEVVGVLE